MSNLLQDLNIDPVQGQNQLSFYDADIRIKPLCVFDYFLAVTDVPEVRYVFADLHSVNGNLI